MKRRHADKNVGGDEKRSCHDLSFSSSFKPSGVLEEGIKILF